MRYQFNIEKHREWMLRAYVISYVIIAMRPAVVFYVVIAGVSQGEALAMMAPLIWIIAILGVESYINLQRIKQKNNESAFIPPAATQISLEDMFTDATMPMFTTAHHFIPVTLVKKKDLSTDASLFVFQLPLRAELLSFPGHHVVLRSKIRGTTVCRPYTPVTTLLRYLGNSPALQEANIPATLALTIKRYDQGKMSKWLHDSLEVGDQVEVMEATGVFSYFPNKYASIGLIAGGTGITAMMSLIVNVLRNPDDVTKISLVFANSSEKQIIFQEELNQLARVHPNKFSVDFVLGREELKETLATLLPSNENCLIAVCGPVGFTQAVQKCLSPTFSDIFVFENS
jgi:cytochrome-b5 reductase